MRVHEQVGLRIIEKRLYPALQCLQLAQRLQPADLPGPVLAASRPVLALEARLRGRRPVGHDGLRGGINVVHCVGGREEPAGACEPAEVAAAERVVARKDAVQQLWRDGVESHLRRPRRRHQRGATTLLR